MAVTSGSRRVVIVGGGFAGLFAARALRRAPVQVTLIDRAEHHLFQPLLYQCATGILSEGKIAIPLRELLRKLKNVEFVLAEATGLDAAGRKVTARRPLGEEIEFGYDYLILAAGVRQSYFGHDEYAAVAPGMKSIEDALKIRRRVFGAFEMAESADDPAERRPLAHLRPGGGRANRGGAGRADPGGRPPRPWPRSSGTSSPRTPGSCCSMAAAPHWPCSARNFCAGRPRPEETRCRAAHGLHRHRSRPAGAAGQGP